MSERFYATFGQRYRMEDHPSGLPVHPDAVIGVRAPDYDSARALVVDLFGLAFGSVYEWLDPDVYTYYPLGVQLWLDAEDEYGKAALARMEVRDADG